MNFISQSRRDFFRVGAVGGLSLPYLLKNEAHGALKHYESKEGVAKNVIHVYLPGGMAAQESWDPKPFAPLEYRGPFGAINTKVPGLQFSETMKNMANVADKVTVIHSMTHGEAAHERGTHNMFTGYKPSPAVAYPSFGAVVSHELGSRKGLPPYVTIPQQPNEYAGTGYLSSKYNSFGLGSDPASANFKVRDLMLPNGISADRFAKRRSLLETVENNFNEIQKSDKLSAMSSFYSDAYTMISSPEAQAAFDINKESDKNKERYGKNQAGMRMLLARRLVESGVRLVTLTYGGWDHHQNIETAFGTRNGPELDQALASLISDLDERGMLDETLVMVSSEFGRTPKINKDNGRDHWPRVFSTLLAGGGIKRGYVYGSSDAFSTEPEENPMSVPDFATTVYNQIGITADKELMAPGERPIEIVDGGKVITDILI
tara:strand:- start:381 stop:1676 length:1296 start_codon:yes stop_codon:yes gene_type:complete